MSRRLGVVAVLAMLVACSSAAKPPSVPTSSGSPSLLHTCIDKATTDALASGTVVELTTSDAVHIKGVLFGSGTRGVVLAHMGRPQDNLCQWALFASKLKARGIAALAIDLRGYGVSEAVGGAVKPRQDLDVAAAVAELRTRGAQKIIVGGADLGGTASLLAALAAKPPVAGVFNLAGTSIFETLDASAVPSRLTVPALFAVAELDLTTRDDIRKQYAETRAKEKTLAIIPGYEHGTNLFYAHEAGKLEAALLTFIEFVTK